MNKNVALWIIIGLFLIAIFNLFQTPSTSTQHVTLDYTDFLSDAKSGQINEVTIRGETAIGKLSDGSTFTSYIPAQDSSIVQRLIDSGVKVKAAPPEEEMPAFFQILISWLPMILLIGVWIFFMRQMQSGGNKAMGFGKSKARLMEEGSNKVTFQDVAGVNEAKEELEEVVEFLRDPQKFQRLGGKIPRGVLLVGPPGTGKTLLARAIAGEANVPFFTISGSDFVEMFVGVGASRVRDLFEQGKKNAPCIIFIDEIDAVGRHRGAGLGGGNDEREQTLNQLLVEMDGFEANDGVILIAATNRPDVLDPALLRPGRFDRQVVVPNPDVAGREQILKVHMRNVPLAPDVDAQIIARGTPGFSGADLANLVNEAALLAARRNKRVVSMAELEEAKDKVMMGAERRTLAMSDEEKKLTAYHESGHAVVAFHSPGSDPIHKATIIPRGRALGMVMRLPEGDRVSMSRSRIYADLAVAMGGRIAEELIFGYNKVTTGASSDNGIKLFTHDGKKLSDEIELEIEARIQSEIPLAAPSKLGYVQRIPDAGGRYIEFVKNSISRDVRLDGLHIVLDCANGAAHRVAPTVLHELGAHVIRMGCEPNGININDECGATHTSKLSQKVVETGADLGIALDGDADRVVFCDEHGREINGDQIMALIGTQWHREGKLKNNAVVATVMSNLGLERYLEAEGLKLIRTPVGHRYVAEKMRDEGYNVGGEQSGHIILNDFSSAGDGLLTALQVLSVFAQAKKPASQLFNVFTPYPQILKNIKLDPQVVKTPDAENFIEALQVKLGKDGRVLVRPSGTEPLVRIMVEGPDTIQIQNDAEILAEQLIALAQES